MAEYIEIDGDKDVERLIDSLLSTNQTMDKFVRKLIAKVMGEARGRVSKDISVSLANDPRKAYKAVKRAVYKQLFGGNISILAKRKASSSRATLVRQRKLDLHPYQRGGNRIKRSDRTKQLDSYYGSDRGFVLRFLNSGTSARQTRFGNRGAITGNNMFGHIAPWHMEQAVDEISDAVAEYITQKAHG